MRDAWIEVDLGAIVHNVDALRAWVEPAALCAVVKADGYGHGAAPVARAVLDAGAQMLAVALAEEGIELREAGISASILILSESPLNAFGTIVANGLTPTLYRPEAVDAAERAASNAGVELGVHVKVDTGMHRVGVAPGGTVELVRKIESAPHLGMVGLFTHFAVADERDDSFTRAQIARFDAVRDARVRAFRSAWSMPRNSAGAIRNLGRFDLVRCGISIYGFAPSPEMGDPVGLRPALSLHARVSFVKSVAPGEGLSYGLHYRPEATTTIVTVPLGYADGVRRCLSRVGAQVLIGGRRYPIVGTITMDQLLVDCGAESQVSVGDEVVLLGAQGDDEITAQEWADRLDTITYEIVCGFSPRLPRIHVR